MEINEENTSCDMCPRKDGGGGILNVYLIFLLIDLKDLYD